MLRITVRDNPRVLTFQLEGKLAGPWLRELEACWHSTLAGDGKPVLRVDLTDITYIDAAGRDCLATLYRHGAKFVCADCVTHAVVDEITQAPVSDSERRLGSGVQDPNRGAT
jgi:hypothetical protein